MATNTDQPLQASPSAVLKLCLGAELRGDYAFCHLDLSLNNSMLVSDSVVLIDWANACRRDGDAGEHTTSAACHLAKTMVRFLLQIVAFVLQPCIGAFLLPRISALPILS